MSMGCRNYLKIQHNTHILLSEFRPVYGKRAALEKYVYIQIYPPLRHEKALPPQREEGHTGYIRVLRKSELAQELPVKNIHVQGLGQVAGHA